MNKEEKLIACFDDHDYKADGTMFQRIAARAIIHQGNQFAMIHSTKYGEYKFPGGGMKRGEELEDTLIREVKEETGMRVVVGSLYYVGKVIERCKGEVEDIFEMISYYFTCTVDEKIGAQNLDEYEEEYGYQLEYVPLDDAIRNNEQLKDISEVPWVKRDTYVMHYLKKESFCGER